jgi:hypothetical protein
MKAPHSPARPRLVAPSVFTLKFPQYLRFDRLSQLNPKMIRFRDDFPSTPRVEHLGTGDNPADVIEQTVELNATIHVPSIERR